MNEWPWLIVATVLTFLLLAALHWMPQRRKLGRLTRYICGVACLFAGFATWRLPLGDWQSVLGLAAIVIVGGLAVMGAYTWDDITKDRRKVEKVESTDDQLRKP